MYAQKRRRELNPRFVALCLAGTFLLAGAGLWLWHGSRGLPGEDIEMPDYVEKDYLTVNEWSRPGTPLERVRGVVVHYVGNPGTTARANRNYFDSLASGKEGVYASAHFVIGLEGETIQCVPLTEVAYASNTRNGDTVSIEVCHPDDTGAFAPASYDRCVELTAWLCKSFRLDPERDLLRHYDVSGKVCPRYFVDHPEAWDAFQGDVAAALEALEAEKDR